MQAESNFVRPFTIKFLKVKLVRNLFAKQSEKIVYTLNRMTVPVTAQSRYHSTYGIDAYRQGCKLYEVKDITVDREKLEKLINLCNREQLSLLHLGDVVEDFLACL